MPAAKPAPDTVTVRVLKHGHDKISTGEHVVGEGEIHYSFGDIIEGVDRAIAEALEERHYVEIQ